MKRIFLFAAALLFSITILAQEPHLKFKGIPVDGNYKVFADKLIRKGFKQKEVTNEMIVLTGTFMTIPDVTVLVCPDPTSKKVSRVAAMIKAAEGTSVRRLYNTVVDVYKEKYGQPMDQESDSSDGFYDPYSKSGNSNKSQWDVEGGRIVVSISGTALDGYVMCTYIDDQNAKALHQTILNDI